LNSKKRKRLDKVVSAIQLRWGSKALQQGQQARPAVAAIPTSFPALDQALGLGGIPRHSLTEILGAPTSGLRTLALKIMAQAQTQKDNAAYIDLHDTFDPDYAQRCGVNLDRLLLARPSSGSEALGITQSLVASRGVGVLVFDTASHLLADPSSLQTLSAALRQFPRLLSQSPCALIFLTPLPLGTGQSPPYAGSEALAHTATVRLLLKKEQWLQKRGFVYGYRAQVEVVRNRLGKAGRTARISITFNGVVKGDGTRSPVS
jgi:recombination protein RecA